MMIRGLVVSLVLVVAVGLPVYAEELDYARSA